MEKFKGKNVLITGGASGIGRLMGAMALDKGAATLIIWDINQENIDNTISEFSNKGKVIGHRVDVSNEQNVIDAAKTAKKELGEIDIVINCAGIITSNKTFDRYESAEIHRTMNINAIAPMIVAQQFLPDMIKRNSGHICNISSAGGLVANPKMSVYAASKWAVIGWSDSVRIELEQMRSNVRITTVAPYYIKTGMFDGVQSPIVPLMEPEYAARHIIKAIEKNKKMAVVTKLIPFPYHFVRLMQGILPTVPFDWLFGKVFGFYHSMDHFTGRK
ncbi:MAG: SDR family NAD(P)-dependent oxidoreductase [Paraprevotella sp.]|nr:SDR family NAD(P)-dependent oxidoreductase [Paraprevotella sp.]